jgi:hypothetical protein
MFLFAGLHRGRMRAPRARTPLSSEPENALAEMGDQPEEKRLIPVVERSGERKFKIFQGEDNAEHCREPRKFKQGRRGIPRQLGRRR